jgi:hypothetical protein
VNRPVFTVPKVKDARIGGWALHRHSTPPRRMIAAFVGRTFNLIGYDLTTSRTR